VVAGDGQIPAIALRGYGVDAAAMSFWPHESGIHIECGPPGAGAGDAGVTETAADQDATIVSVTLREIGPGGAYANTGGASAKPSGTGVTSVTGSAPAATYSPRRTFPPFPANLS
jgi:hypothetical protein